jgi:hypothetical protein
VTQQFATINGWFRAGVAILSIRFVEQEENGPLNNTMPILAWGHLPENGRDVLRFASVAHALQVNADRSEKAGFLKTHTIARTGGEGVRTNSRRGGCAIVQELSEVQVDKTLVSDGSPYVAAY